MSATNVDYWAWKVVEAVSTAQPDPDYIQALASKLASAGPPIAAITALAGHASTALRLYAHAAGEPLAEALDEYADMAGLARLAAELEDDGGEK